MKKSRQLLIMLSVMACSGLGLLAACTGAGGGGGGGADAPCIPIQMVYLRAEPFLKTLADGTTVPMWGYAQDTAFGATDGEVTSPGPEIRISHCALELEIVLDNNLPVPTSIVMNGLAADMIPVYGPDGRMRSFTNETLPGNTAGVLYEWEDVRPGTFLYQSGTSPQVQVQMGLYGAAYRDLAPLVPYPGHTVQAEVAVLYSEIDPVFHRAVADDDFGPGKTITSTVNYAPKYLLANGDVVPPSGCLDVAMVANQNLLVRYLNAGLRSHGPVLNGARYNVVAEDGNPYLYPKSLVALMLTAGKTMDAVVTAPPGKVCLVMDRMF